MIISQVKQGLLAGRKEIHLEKYGGVKEHKTHLSYCNGTLAGRLHRGGTQVQRGPHLRYIFRGRRGLLCKTSAYP